MKMRLFASFLAAIIIASGMLGAFYFTGAHISAAQVQRPVLTVSPRVVPPGATIHVTGSGFEQQSSVSVSLAKVLSNATFESGSAYLVRSPAAAVSPGVLPASLQAKSSGGILGNALSALSNLFGGAVPGTNNSSTPGSISSGNTSSTTGSTFADNSTLPVASQHTLFVLQSQPGASSNATLSCQNQTVVQVPLSASGVTVANVPSGTQIDQSCSVTIASTSGPVGQNSTFSNVTSPQAGIALFSKVVKSNSLGGFSGQVRIPAAAAGEFAVLAQGTGDANGFAIVNVRSATTATPPPAVTPPANQTSSANQTASSSSNSSNATTTSTNTTSPVSPPVQNNSAPPTTQSTPPAATSNAAGNSSSAANSSSSASSSSNSSASANVQVSENELQPGSPVAVSGSGFRPQVPVQVFINNVQITNIITNVQGSFDTVIVVPTTVNSGSANVVVKAQQTNISKQVTIVQAPPSGTVQHTLVTFNAVLASSGTQALSGAPVTVLDSSNGHIVKKGKTPLEINDLPKGTYSVFYSDFGSYSFVSAAPGKWTATNNGGAGIIAVSGFKDMTITAMYANKPAPPPAPSPVKSSMTLAAQDTSGNPMPGMFVTVYSSDASQIVQQGYTTMKVTGLLPGTYPVFFANFGSAVFASASPGAWVQTPYGGAGLVTVPDDGQSHDIAVTAVYQVSQTTIQEQPSIQAPLDLSGTIYTITANTTQPSGPQVISGTFHLKVSSDNPAQASLSAYMVSANDDTNPNVSIDSQSSRDHHTLQIVDLKPSAAGAIGPNAYAIAGTADLLVDGTMYASSEKVLVTVSGGDDLTPTNVQIIFQGKSPDSAANRLDTLYGAVDLGLK